MNFKDAFDPIRSLKATFNAMNLAPAQLWGGGLLIAFLDACTQNSGRNNSSSGGASEEVFFMVACVGCSLGLIAFLAACWVRPGVFLNLKSVLETDEADSKGIFDHRGLFVQVLLASLLKGAIGLVVTLLVMSPLIAMFVMALSFSTTAPSEGFGSAILIGGIAFFFVIGLPTLIYLFCGLALVGEIVIYENASPMEALSRSWNLASGNRLQIFLYGLVTGIFALLGLLLCCIGVIATSAVTTLAWGEAYLQLSDSERATDAHRAAKKSPDEDSDDPDERRIRLD
jgi:hypothetical protein